MKHRLYNKLKAKLFGGWWISCPLCRQMFGEHELWLWYRMYPLDEGFVLIKVEPWEKIEENTLGRQELYTAMCADCVDPSSVDVIPL